MRKSKSYFEDIEITTKTAGKVPKYSEKIKKDTGSQNGPLNIFFNVCGIILALATLPLGQSLTMSHSLWVIDRGVHR